MKILKLGSIAAVAMLFVSVMSTVAQPQQGGQNGQRQGQQQQGTPEEQAKAMTERLVEPLALTEKQQEQIYEINLEAIEARKQTQEGERPDREAMMKAREELTKKIKAVLTEEQVKKYEELESQSRQRQQGQQQGQGRRQQ